MVFEVELARHNCNSSFLIFLSFTAELTDRAENAVALSLSFTPSFVAVTIYLCRTEVLIDSCLANPLLVLLAVH